MRSAGPPRRHRPRLPRRLLMSPRGRRTAGCPHGLPPGLTQASAQDGSPRRPEDPAPSPRAAFPKYHPKSALNAVGCLSARYGKSPPEGDADAPAPCSELTEKQGRGVLSFAPTFRRPGNKADDSANRRIGETRPAQEPPLPDAFLFPRTSVKARERACPALPLHESSPS